MCGSPNPPDQEVCQVCQARLKPLMPQAAEGPSGGMASESIAPTEPTSQTPEQGDAFQWLQEFRPRQGGEDWTSDLGEEEALPSAEESNEVELFARLRQRAVPEEQPSSELTSLPEGWAYEFQMEDEPTTAERLSRLAAEETPAESAPTPPIAAPTEERKAEASEAFEEGALPEWLSELAGEAALFLTPSEAEIPPSMPEVSQAEVREDTPDGSSEGQPEAGGEGLPTGELPSWLEAMRPSEITPPSEEDYERVESAGPLAGLRGILAAEPEIAKPQKPPALPAFLRVSEKQRAHAEILKLLIEQEVEIQPLPRAKRLESRLLRIFIAVLLLFVLLLPISLNSQLAPLPTDLSEVLEISRLISTLPEQAVVLVAFDYEPGLSAEMDAVASAVLDHLMLRGAHLALLSTSPHGPILAERFIQTIQATHRYRSGQEYLNLGYIPGGIAGLSALVADPQRTMPFALQGVPAWGSTTPLRSVRRITDFSLVMVITDNPDGARAWIEQVQPALQAGNIPLVMVLSAQAEPLVRPYYEATPRQVAGLVVGLRGGAAYARLTGRGGLPRMYWDAFSLGLLLAGLTLLLGGILQTLLHEQSLGKGREEAQRP